jgi:hypothetical protein
MPISKLVPLVPFLATSAVYSTRRLQVCCTLRRPLGSPCFTRRASASGSPRTEYPSKPFPRQQANSSQWLLPSHPEPVPSRRCSAAVEPAMLPSPALLLPHPTSGSCSIDESVATLLRFHSRGARCSLGLMFCHGTQLHAEARCRTHMPDVHVKDRFQWRGLSVR